MVLIIRKLFKKYIFYFLGKYILGDKLLIKIRFYFRLKRKVNLSSPVFYNDKIQWLKLNWYDPQAILCADKYSVREFVKEKIGESYLNKIYGVFDSVDDIDIAKLPKSFVLKSTHGTGEVIIVKDKNKVDWNHAKKEMRKWLKSNIYWTTREWVYKDIKPRIICEKYLIDEELEDLRDYKIFCFNGEPKIIQVHMDRFGEHKKQHYDTEWNLLNLKTNYNTDVESSIKPPEQLVEMLRLSEKLSEDFPHVRVDLYIVNNKIIFGELTFFPGSGFIIFENEEDDKMMGDWLTLPKK